MSDKNEYLNGLIFKAPHENAPEYVKAKVSIKRVDLIAALDERHEDWINLDLKVSQQGKYHAPIDNWKPNGGNASTPAPRQSRPQPAQATDGFGDGGFQDDDIPF